MAEEPKRSTNMAKILNVFEEWGDGVAEVELFPSGEKKNVTLPKHEPGAYVPGDIVPLSLDEEEVI